MNNELFYKLALLIQPHYGPATIKKLLQEFGSAENVFQHKSNKRHEQSHWRNFAFPVVTPEIGHFVEKEMFLMEKHSIHLCYYNDENFPARLRACSDAPVHFFYQGNGRFNYPKAVAVVGTRNASTYGKEATRKIIEELAAHEITIVSGLAHGIDTQAHTQSLTHALPTIAVMGCGLKTIYPAENRELAQRILQADGTLVSEYFYAAKPDRQNFPQRNRIIAGLADATVVIETATKGGSIITAHIANSYNRDVFAVPGNIFHPTHDGCHQLIRKNIAALVQSGNDIIEMMNWDIATPTVRQPELFLELSPDEKELVTFLQQRKEAYIDELIELKPDLSVSKVTSLLLGLEFKGVIECKPGKRYVSNY